MVTPSGSGWSMPSQYTPPSLVSATFVKTVFLIMVAMALGFVFAEVPGATPKKPFSGLMARRLPSNRNQRERLSKCLFWNPSDWTPQCQESLTLFIKLHPGNVIAHTLDLPARKRGAKHGQICLPAGTWECSRHVLLLTSRVGDAQNLRDNWVQGRPTMFTGNRKQTGLQVPYFETL